MFLRVVCPRCQHPFEIDDADCSSACPTCKGEWECNVDAEEAWESDLAFEYCPTFESSIGSLDAFADAWQDVATKTRPKRREPSLLRNILPPILGGLTAIPIALAVLWYGLGRDLGNAGPAVARYAPWIVPEALQGIARRNANLQRAKPVKPKTRMDFGELGSRSRDLSDKDVPEPSPSDTSDFSPAILRNEYERFETIVAFIEKAGKQWDSTPSPQRIELQKSVYQKTLQLAEIARREGTWMDRSMPKFKSWIDLIGQVWYADAIEQSAKEALTEEQPPELNQVLVWPVREITLHGSGDPLENCNLEPPLAMGIQAVHWFADEPIAAQIRQLLPVRNSRPQTDVGPVSTSGRRLLVGRVDRMDEQGLRIRVEAIIPR